MRRITSALIAQPLLGLFALSFACASARPPYHYAGPAPTNAEDRAMAQLSERYLDITLRLDPVRASALGYHKWDGRMPDYSVAGIQAALRTVEGLEKELARVDAKKLSRPFATDRALMGEELARLRFVYGTLDPFTWDVQLYNEQIGAGLYYLTIPPADPAEWPARLEALAARVEALPGFLAAAQARLGHPPKAFTEFVVAQNPGNLKTLQDILPPLFKGQPKLEARLAKARPAAEKALTEFQAFLEGTLLPRSDGDWRLGSTRFAQKLAHTLGTDLSPQAVYEGAERGLEQARFQMYDVALPLFQAAFPNDHSYLDMLGDERIDYVVGKVITEASKRHGTAESLFSDVTKKAEAIKTWLRTTDFIELPPATDPFVIEPTPAYLDGLAVAFYNPAPAFEPDLKKSYWISTVPNKDPADTESFLQEYNDYILDALTIHEAFPGHYVQLYWSSHATDASIVKRVLESGPMAEGWAMMVERLMHEEGFGKDDPRQLLFHLKLRLRVFINAMIDVRMHTTNAGDPDALDAWAMELMTKRGFQEEAEASRKLRRAKLTSTQLCTYYVGYQEMLDIFRAAAAKGKLSPKEIRMKMMSYGTIPPRIIKEKMAEEGLL
ncbi:MAG: DUF885 domain-containing protein [Myxococcales bacterium]|nr:DUF885 domain-containing protein [Myxococcales bacterium]